MWFYTKKIFWQIWSIIAGVFYLGWRVREREKRELELDTHHFFKRRLRKEQALWQMKEQIRVKQMWKACWWLPKNFRKKNEGWLFHNYFSGVLTSAKPNQTPEQLLAEYWRNGAGPFFLLWFEAVKSIDEVERSNAVLENKLADIRKIIGTLPPVEERAKNILEVTKKTAMKMKKEEEKLKADRRKKLDERDNAMLDLDEKILSDKQGKANEKLKEIRKARKGL